MLIYFFLCQSILYLTSKIRLIYQTFLMSFFVRFWGLYWLMQIQFALEYEYANIAIKILNLSIQIVSKLILGLFLNNSFKNVGLQWSTKFLCEMRKNDILSALEFICNLQKFVCVYTITDKSESWFNHVQFICPYTVWTNILGFFSLTNCHQMFSVVNYIPSLFIM